MAKTVVGLFDTAEEAQAVVRDLIDEGFDRSNISIVANDAQGKTRTTEATTDDSDGEAAAKGAGAGALTGGLIGGGIGLVLGLIGTAAIPVVGPIIAAGPIAATLTGAGIGAAAGGLIGALVGAGVPEEHANVYAEGVKRGGTLVMVNATDESADDAYDVMERHGAIDIDERSSAFRQAGWNGQFDANDTNFSQAEIDAYRTQQANSRMNTQTPTTTASSTTGQSGSHSTATGSSTTPKTNLKQTINQGGEAVIPIVEEELQVGKRAVERGGVRVYTRVEEQPVQEQIQLREENVNVERRQVDRPVTQADMSALQNNSTLEVRETSEEAVVSKQARVVEEVVVNKEVNQRTETINDTLRRTDVDVEEVGGTTHASGTQMVGTRRFEDYDKDFRTHYQTNFGTSGMKYDQYSPIYRYGYDLAGNSRYQGRQWNEIESDVRSDWETKNPNSPWEKVKDSVQYAWNRVSNAARNVGDDISGRSTQDRF